MAAPSAIFTIGYEGLVQTQLIDLLAASKVARVLDVRAIASSRKAGFSKTLLAASLAEAGIGYRHDRRLGTPKPGRQAARAGRSAEMAAIFSDHMTRAEPQLALSAAIQDSQKVSVCLLCFEKEAHDCHRSIVAAMMHARTGQVIRHL